jgi:hypothetical protein
MLAQNPTVNPDRASQDLLDAYRTRGLVVVQEIRSKLGNLHSSEVAANLLSLSLDELETFRKANKILGLPVADSQWEYPSFQIVQTAAGSGLLSGLDLVLAALKDSDAWEKAAFLIDPLASTIMSTPLAAIQAGRIEEVVTLAQGFGEQGTA